MIPNWESFASRELTGEYDRKEDILFLYSRSAKGRPAISMDVDGEFWLRLDPESSEVLAIEIDDFESLFLKKHAEVARIWEQASTGPRAHPERKQSVLQLLLQWSRERFAAPIHASAHARIAFGKHKGRTFKEIALQEPEFLEWMLREGVGTVDQRECAESALAEFRGARSLPTIDVTSRRIRRTST
jgi:hypothetical protein